MSPANDNATTPNNDDDPKFWDGVIHRLKVEAMSSTDPAEREGLLRALVGACAIRQGVMGQTRQLGGR